MSRQTKRTSMAVALGLESEVISEGFHSRVFACVRQVPAGAVATYGDIATVLGSPRVARQVGWALAALSESSLPTSLSDVPWHRVINAQGRISHRGDVYRAEQQQARLEAEGHSFDASGRIQEFAARRWRLPAASPTPPIKQEVQE